MFFHIYLLKSILIIYIFIYIFYVYGTTLFYYTQTVGITKLAIGDQ